MLTITFSAPVQISGDADIYIVTRDPAATTVTLPTQAKYTWRSLNTGADTVSVSYEDSKFCSNCEYIIGELTEC